MTTLHAKYSIEIHIDDEDAINFALLDGALCELEDCLHRHNSLREYDYRYYIKEVEKSGARVEVKEE